MQDFSKIGAIIFCAGLGTRFKPWTNHHPKALAVINGKTLLQRNIEYLQMAGVKNIVVNVHHFATQIINALSENNGWGSQILISNEEEEVLETGGGLKKAAKLLQEYSHFFAINVDILSNLHLQNMLNFHIQNHAICTLATSTRSTSRVLLFDEKHKLCGWKNIQTGEERIVVPTYPVAEKAFSGISVFSNTIFSHMQLNGKFSLIDLWLQLAPHHTILELDHTGDAWIDVGRPENIAQAELLFG